MQSSLVFVLNKVLPKQAFLSFMIHQVESQFTKIIEFGIVFKVKLAQPA